MDDHPEQQKEPQRGRRGNILAAIPEPPPCPLPPVPTPLPPPAARPSTQQPPSPSRSRSRSRSNPPDLRILHHEADEEEEYEQPLRRKVVDGVRYTSGSDMTLIHVNGDMHQTYNVCNINEEGLAPSTTTTTTTTTATMTTMPILQWLGYQLTNMMLRLLQAALRLAWIPLRLTLKTLIYAVLFIFLITTILSLLVRGACNHLPSLLAPPPSVCALPSPICYVPLISSTSMFADLCPTLPAWPGGGEQGGEAGRDREWERGRGPGQRYNDHYFKDDPSFSDISSSSPSQIYLRYLYYLTSNLTTLQYSLTSLQPNTTSIKLPTSLRLDLSNLTMSLTRLQVHLKDLQRPGDLYATSARLYHSITYWFSALTSSTQESSTVLSVVKDVLSLFSGSRNPLFLNRHHQQQKQILESINQRIDADLGKIRGSRKDINDIKGLVRTVLYEIGPVCWQIRVAKDQTADVLLQNQHRTWWSWSRSSDQREDIARAHMELAVLDAECEARRTWLVSVMAAWEEENQQTEELVELWERVLEVVQDETKGIGGSHGGSSNGDADASANNDDGITTSRPMDQDSLRSFKQRLWADLGWIASVQERIINEGPFAGFFSRTGSKGELGQGELWPDYWRRKRRVEKAEGTQVKSD